MKTEAQVRQGLRDTEEVLSKAILGREAYEMTIRALKWVLDEKED